ncbi:Drug/Metabolite Transporter (DMT) Superfamily [Achlya hypogyna]|uniref:Drug/Metabolite Transporter (DMT) Superfamily n=1 Tax=Achlya hypogyna TaxID=1202772 RepID=A0A1V9Z5Y6_ACHHY|nr:Drug/Metabolite Transporter (DMT) Superfamily [Achlya hypogyna]
MTAKYGAAAFACALVLGTSTTLSSKFMYGINSMGLDPEPKPFEKPLMQTFFMFVAMSLALPVYMAFQLCRSPEQRTRLNLRSCLKLCIPAAADLVSTALSCVGLLYVNVSFYQLARCTVIIYVASLKVIFLRFVMTGYMRLGILVNAIAIVVISASALAGTENLGDTVIGVSVMLLACLSTALQYVSEEYYMKKGSKASGATEVSNPPMVVIGMEGIWGSILMLAIVLPLAYVIPGADHGRLEDFFDSVEMMRNSESLRQVCALYIVSITGFNVASIYVTFFLDSVWRSILVNFRPVAVWLASLFSYYVATNHAYGEPWTPWSWLQLGGMLLLFFGTAIYNGNVRFAAFDYAPPDDKEKPKFEGKRLSVSAASSDSEVEPEKIPAVKPDDKRAAAFCFCLALVMGTGSTLSSKIMYGIDAEGRDGTVRHFQKPLMQTFMMFLAMTIAIPFQWLYVRLTKQTETPPLTRESILVLAYPAMADLGATALMSIGLMYVPVSTFQLVRCTIIVFVAVLKVLFLNFKPSGYMQCGIGLNSIAILMVSASCFAEENESSSALLGVGVLLLGCLITSSQYVLEETVMRRKDTPPMMVIGLEGIWGTLMMVTVVFPIAYLLPGNDNGRAEDVLDSLTMIANSGAVRGLCVFYICCITIFNVSSIFVTYLLDSVWRSILANFRPVSVWSMDLALFYIFTAGTLGEPWSPWSWLQFAGMLLLFFGTAVYNGNIRLHWFDYSHLDSVQAILTEETALAIELSNSPVYGSRLGDRKVAKAL